VASFRWASVYRAVLGRGFEFVADPIAKKSPLLFWRGAVFGSVAIILDADRVTPNAWRAAGSAAGTILSFLPADCRWGFSTALWPLHVSISRGGGADVGKLGAYGAVFVFASGNFYSNFLLNTLDDEKTVCGTTPLTSRIISRAA